MNHRSLGVFRIILAALLLCQLSSREARAQAVNGSLLGTVTDATGAVIPGANVDITEVNTDLKRSTITNENGNYVFGSLDRGVYRVEVQLPGFKKVVRDKVDVLVNSDTRVDMRLEAGSITETVEVTAASPLLETDRADVGRQIEIKQIQDMPLANNRNFQGLINLVPGTTRGYIPHSEFFDSQGALATQVNGQSRHSNNVQIEGIDNNLRTQLLNVLIPPIEALSSVDVTTSNYDAELGRAGGAVTNVTLRSGTNEKHGSVYEFNRVNALAARDPFAATRPHTVYNQYGFTFGGPIIKNKTFFFGDYQAVRDRRGDSTRPTIPTMDFRTGDLSAALNLPTPQIVYDPRTGNPDGTGRLPFIGNLIPDDRISLIAKKLLSYIAPPSSPGFANNYEADTVRVKDTDSFDVKIDHHINTSNTFFARYNFQLPKVFDPGVYGIFGGPSGPATDGFAGTGTNKTQSGGFNYTHIFTPAFLAEFRLGFSRYNNVADNTDIGTNIATDIGIPGVNLNRWTSGMPYISIDTYTNPVLGNSASLPWIRAETNVDLVSNWTRVFHNHTVKWGADFRVNRDDLLQTQTFSPRGRFNFRAGTTALNGGGVSGFANSFASFLLDLPSDYGRDLALTFPEVRQKTLFSYVQDKWTVSQKLTLNYGLRHEIYLAPTPMFPGGFSNYNPVTNSLELAGIGGVPSNMGRRTNYKDFAPRFGFAYRVNEKTVVRGGYGISIDPSFPDDKYAFNYPVQQNNGFTAPNTYTAAGSMATGFPSPLVASVPANGIITRTDPNSFYLSIPLDLRETYIQSWNLTVERALPGNFALSTAYVANHAVGVLVQRNINAGAVLGAGAAGQPFNQLFGRKAETRTWVGTNGNYNALQVKLDRRFSNGFLLTTAYTYQKAINYADDNGGLLINSIPSLNRGRAGSDRTHTFVQSYIYELPFGPNKRWLQSGVGGWVLGGWQLNGIFSDYSGLPLDIRISSTSLNTPGNINRPDMIGKPTILGGIGPGKKWFDVTAFGQPAPGKFGTTGRNILNGPKLVNIDLSAFRKFRVTERTNVEFRAESFNFANSPHFDRPQSTLGGTAFGEITSAMADHRLIQFGLKITF